MIYYIREREIDCRQCKKGKLRLGNNFPYSKILVVYYRCDNCGHEIKITYRKNEDNN